MVDGRQVDAAHPSLRANVQDQLLANCAQDACIAPSARNSVDYLNVLASSERPQPTRDFGVLDLNRNEYQGYRGYGVLMFTRSPDLNNARDRQICRSFIRLNIEDSRSRTRQRDRFVTIWPIEQYLYQNITEENTPRDIESVCNYAIENYDYNIVSEILPRIWSKELPISRLGQGPYLVGWLPASNLSNPDAPIIIVDMSSVEERSEIDEVILQWRSDIMSDPKLLNLDSTTQITRMKIRNWLDRFGSKLLMILE
ncbi:hypothetical protein I0K15_07030 [Pontivivens ytuae]|uniref:Uncharacterized protein n=2 Tax=Pontivivens ytuae TaxID=2789856 RepID=A0A7S9LUG8_9RHOB|nr:hypothetical protein I0K15_07030 [Pontivivens ytuae]